MDATTHRGRSTAITEPLFDGVVGNTQLSISQASLRTKWSGLVIASLAATWFVWGSMYLAIQWALPSFPAFYQMGTQFLLAGALLFFFSRWRGDPWPTLRQWLGGAFFGFLMLAVGYGFTALAESSVSSGLVVAFIAVIPTFIALLEWTYGVRPRRRQLVGALIGLGGIIMLTLGQGFQTSLGGLLAITISCVAWSIGSVWSVQGIPGGMKVAVAPGIMGYACQMLTGGVMLLVASRLAGETPAWPPGITETASWAYLMVAGSLISYTAYMVLLEQTTPALAASYTYVNPVVALILGVTLNHETVTRYEWLSVGIALAGVLLLLSDQGAGKASGNH